MKRLTLLFGNITLLDDKAIVHDVQGMLVFDNKTEDEVGDLAEKIIESRMFDTYLIPEVYQNPIEFQEDCDVTMFRAINDF